MAKVIYRLRGASDREYAYRVKELGERGVEPSVLYKHIIFWGWDCGSSPQSQI